MQSNNTQSLTDYIFSQQAVLTKVAIAEVLKRSYITEYISRTTERPVMCTRVFMLLLKNPEGAVKFDVPGDDRVCGTNTPPSLIIRMSKVRRYKIRTSILVVFCDLAVQTFCYVLLNLLPSHYLLELTKATRGRDLLMAISLPRDSENIHNKLERSRL
jgi:hypothetical protein